jgi:hypothetical protein
LLIKHDLELYYVYNKPKHKINFSKNDMNFFKEIKISQKNFLDIPKNIETIRNMQYKDLLNFYNTYIFEGVEVFFVISKMDGDYYFNFEKFIKTNFDLIEIKSFKKIFLEDLNFNFVQNLFNFEELESYHFREIIEDYYAPMLDRAQKLRENEDKKLDFDEFIDSSLLFKNFAKNFG